MKFSGMKLLLLVSTAFAYTNLHEKPVDEAWSGWKSFFSREFGSPVEETNRFNIFKNHHSFVRRVNSEDRGYTLGLNEFAATDPDEFASFYNGLRTDSPFRESRGKPWTYDNTTLPDSVDWRSQGLVNPVKNQGQCGSCWAFSTVVSTEGQFAKVTGKLESLSEQDLVDCVKNVPYEGDKCCMGCKGGLMVPAFEYMSQAQDGTDDTEASYPYKGMDGTCSFKISGAERGVRISNYTQGSGETQLQQMVASVGPISVGVDANISWQLYQGGVYKPKSKIIGCSNDPSKMDHGVAVVGYGPGYWIVRNSWGPGWGEKGYMRLATGGNYCGVANVPAFPVVEKK